MAKIKIPRKSTAIDMTPMVDLAFLLVTFFMLATKFKPDEPVSVVTPRSTSEISIPDKDILMITIDSTGRVFVGVDGQKDRMAMLQKIGDKYNIAFDQNDQETFKLVPLFGVPINQLKDWLALDVEERNKDQKGIPCDSVRNELKDWIWAARTTNPRLRVAIKGDGDSYYPVFREVKKSLQEYKVNRFNLITSYEVEDKPKN